MKNGSIIKWAITDLGIVLLYEFEENLTKEERACICESFYAEQLVADSKNGIRYNELVKWHPEITKLSA